MTNYSKLLGFAMLVSLMSGCATKTPLTRSLLTKYSVQESDLSNLQYYVSSKIKMSREERSVIRKSVDGALQGNESVFKEDVTVTPLTPGISEEGTFDHIYVSFEEGSQFKFSLGDDDRYYLQADGTRTDKEGSSQEANLGMYIFKYRNKEYFSKDIELIHLLVDKSDLSEVEREAHKMKGRRINVQ